MLILLLSVTVVSLDHHHHHHIFPLLVFLRCHCWPLLYVAVVHLPLPLNTVVSTVSVATIGRNPPLPETVTLMSVHDTVGSLQPLCTIGVIG